MALTISGSGINMGGNPTSNVSTVDVVDKAHVSRASVWCDARNCIVVCGVNLVKLFITLLTK